MNFLVFSSVTSSTFNAFSGADSVALSDTTTGQSWLFYPEGKITPTHLFGSLAQLMQPASAAQIASGALGSNFLTATITEAKKIQLSLGGEGMSLIFSSTDMRDQCGFTSSTTTGTTITSNTALLAVECSHLSPTVGVQYLGSNSHGLGSMAQLKSQGEIVAVMTHANLNTLEGLCNHGAYVSPASTERDLFAFTLAVDDISAEQITSTHHRVILRGLVQH